MNAMRKVSPRAAGALAIPANLITFNPALPGSKFKEGFQMNDFLRSEKAKSKDYEEAKERNHALSMVAGRNWNEKIEEVLTEHPGLSYKGAAKIARKKFPDLFREYINTPARINQDIKAYMSERG